MNTFFNTDVRTLYFDHADIYFEGLNEFYQAWVFDEGVILSCDRVGGGRGYITMYDNPAELLEDFELILSEEEADDIKNFIEEDNFKEG